MTRCVRLTAILSPPVVCLAAIIALWVSRGDAKASLAFEGAGYEVGSATVVEELVQADVTSEVCPSVYTGGRSNKTLCFCQFAENGGCAGTACACPQGCRGVTWGYPQVVTFKNLKNAYRCSKTTALLTIPRAYAAHITHLTQVCPKMMHVVLMEMLLAGFRTYVETVGPGPVMQCIHAPKFISVAWLHVHTFCADGRVDGMPTRRAVAWCGAMASEVQAAELAGQIVSWVTSGFKR